MHDKDIIDVDVIEIEIIDENGDVAVKPISAVENLININGYNDLITKIHRLNIENDVGYGDGKAYDPNLGQAIWKNQVMIAKPIETKNESQQHKLRSIYKLVYYCVETGEYPLMQMLCNYLGITLDELILSLTDINNSYREIYLWAYRLFESTANMNALKSNGNFAARKWLDESREHKVSADTQLTTMVEMKRIDALEKLGEELFAEFMIEED